MVSIINICVCDPFWACGSTEKHGQRISVRVYVDCWGRKGSSEFTHSLRYRTRNIGGVQYTFTCRGTLILDPLLIFTDFPTWIRPCSISPSVTSPYLLGLPRTILMGSVPMILEQLFGKGVFLTPFLHSNHIWLRPCLCATPLFGPMAIPVYLEKLLAASPATKVQYFRMQLNLHAKFCCRETLYRASLCRYPYTVLLLPASQRVNSGTRLN